MLERARKQPDGINTGLPGSRTSCKEVAERLAGRSTLDMGCTGWAKTQRCCG